MCNKKIDSKQIQVNTAALLMLVAHADDKIEENELSSIKEILIDFFNIDLPASEQLIIDSQELIKKSTDIYQIGSIVKESMTSQDLIDLLCCIFEVAYADENLHFMERHIIKKIVNILNIDNEDMIKANKNIKDYLI